MLRRCYRPGKRGTDHVFQGALHQKMNSINHDGEKVCSFVSWPDDTERPTSLLSGPVDELAGYIRDFSYKLPMA